jgi:hypothetical protein
MRWFQYETKNAQFSGLLLLTLKEECMFKTTVATIATLLFLSHAQAAEPKEWTFLVFLNGNNSLSSFATEDVNEMEAVGSTNQLDVVVQFANNNGKAKRIHVEKDTDMTHINSTIVEELGDVDMGSSQNLVDFVKWAMVKYPAKHYMLDIWNHGNGWHRIAGAAKDLVNVNDISFDDRHHSRITTQQLGAALAQVTQDTGHKIDVYGSDACLMAMAEVVGEMKTSVDVMVGSEETEPGDGWPYDDFLGAWANKPGATAEEVGSMLVETYFASYNGGSQGTKEVTLSAFKVSELDNFFAKIRVFSDAMIDLSARDKSAIKSAAEESQYFTYADYRDVSHFMDKLKLQSLTSLDPQIFADIKTAAQKVVIANRASSSFDGAFGITMWVPTSANTFESHLAAYQQLEFDKQTHWSEALKRILE